MMMKLLHKLVMSEEGVALPVVIICLAVVILMLPPLLYQVSDGINAAEVVTDNTREQYSVDSGIEHACYRLLNDSEFVESMTEQHPTEDYEISINGEAVSVNVTRIAGMSGDTLTANVDYVISSGHQLELRVVVSDDDHMHFAYDTEAYPAWLQMPVSAGNPTYYLHNNPTPPTGDTDAQADLVMDEDNPTATTLYNYDQNYDSSPGRKIEEGDGGPDGLELKEYQNWLTPVYSEDTHFDGTVVLNLYIAPDGFNFDNEGEFTVYLRDYDPVADSYTEITSSTYEVEEEQWVEMWQPTAPEGKYRIMAAADNTEVKAIVNLGFGYLNIIEYSHDLN